MTKPKARSRKADEGVRRGTHSDHLSAKIENLILAGEIKPGEKLDEVKLAAEFGVSRTPVREAIQRLFASGLIENRPRKGTIVAQLGVPRLIGMIEMMAELDVLAARLAAKRATAEEKKAIAGLLDKSRRMVADHDGYTRMNREMHWAIYAATHNQYVEELAVRTWKLLQPYRSFRLDQLERRKESLQEHEQIVHGIAAGDADAAARHMRAHVKVGGVIADFVFTLRMDAMHPDKETAPRKAVRRAR
jgi:DNA-binding GntR family transcriptional regulator